MTGNVPLRRPDLPSWHELNDPRSQNGPCDKAADAGSHVIENPSTARYRCVLCRRTWTENTPNF